MTPFQIYRRRCSLLVDRLFSAFFLVAIEIDVLADTHELHVRAVRLGEIDSIFDLASMESFTSAAKDKVMTSCI